MSPVLQLGGVSTVPTFAYYIVGGLVVAALAFLGGYQTGTSRTESKDLEVIENLEGAEGFRMKRSPPGSKPGILSSYFKERKKYKALGDGTVRWHLVGAAFEEPRYVKPERKEGGNVPELKHDGQTYNFPSDAAVTSEEEGVPVVIHRKGESDPINLDDDWELAVDAGTLAQYLTLRVTSRKPQTGLLDALGLGDYDSMTILRFGILIIVVLAIGWSVLGGG